MLNVGANKGFNLVEWMQRYTDADVSNRLWHRLMMNKADPPCKLQCCGVCLICHKKRTRQMATARLQLHAFELQPSNERLLRQLVALTGAQATRKLQRQRFSRRLRVRPRLAREELVPTAPAQRA